MRKVKGFKLELRPKEVQRLAKKAGLDWAAVGGTESLPAELARASKLVAPAVLFETFPGSEAQASGLASVPGVAFSVLLATLGPAMAARRLELESSEPERARLWSLICRCALDEAVRFAVSLIESEAVLENCELSPLSPLSGADVLAGALKRMDAAKIGVSLNGESLAPPDSAAVSVSWLSKSRPRRKA